MQGQTATATYETQPVADSVAVLNVIVAVEGVRFVTATFVICGAAVSGASGPSAAHCVPLRSAALASDFSLRSLISKHNETLVRSLGVGARRLKTDRRDAQRLSEVSCRIHLPSVHVPTQQSREHKTMCGMREALVGARKKLVNTVCAGRAEAMTLEPLSAAGVADVLDHFGLELRLLSSRVDVVAELHRLSGGDPLLVRLYVNAFSTNRGTASRLEPRDLSQIQPGLPKSAESPGSSNRRIGLIRRRIHVVPFGPTGAAVTDPDRRMRWRTSAVGRALDPDGAITLVGELPEPGQPRGERHIHLERVMWRLKLVLAGRCGEHPSSAEDLRHRKAGDEQSGLL